MSSPASNVAVPGASAAMSIATAEAGAAAVAAALPSEAVNAHRLDLSAEEYFDVLNADGTPAGRTKLRAHVHRDGDWHACVHIWVMHAQTGEVLLQQRAAHKDSFPSCWDVSCAGHLSAGESVTAACAAELAEELGLRAPAGVPFASWCRFVCTLPREVVSQGGRFIDREHTHCFLVELAGPEADTGAMVLQEAEVSAVRWAPLDEVVSAFKAAEQGFVSMPDFDVYDQAVFGKMRERSRQIREERAQAKGEAE